MRTHALLIASMTAALAFAAVIPTPTKATFDTLTAAPFHSLCPPGAYCTAASTTLLLLTTTTTTTPTPATSSSPPSPSTSPTPTQDDLAASPQAFTEEPHAEEAAAAASPYITTATCDAPWLDWIRDRIDKIFGIPPFHGDCTRPKPKSEAKSKPKAATANAKA